MKARVKEQNYYLTSTYSIGRYLRSVLKNWGYYVFLNRSNKSDSCYLETDTGSMEEPNSILIRVSNHPVMNEKTVDYDVYAGFERTGAVSYIDLIVKLAELLGHRVPSYLLRLHQGTYYYRQYRIQLRERANIAETRGYWPDSWKLYVS